MKAIVLAGGGGTRLWPLSRDHFPKQFLSLDGPLSFLQKTVLRLKKAPFIDRIVVATNILHQELVFEQLRKIDAHELILVEPCRRNTAAAIALALKTLEQGDDLQSSDPVLVVPSDHLIEPEVIFLNALQQLEPRDQLVTFGIRPTKPETGYGYIEIGDPFSPGLFKVKQFIEKPDLKTAETYVSNPHFFWNSGMFLFAVQTFWDELFQHAPVLWNHFQAGIGCARQTFGNLPDLSIDYAIMEKSKNVVVCPLALSWSDVGSWDSVYEFMEKDRDQNVKIGQILSIDTTNSLIIGGKRMISTIGLEDLLIIDTEEAVLISKKGESQRVKALIDRLKALSSSASLDPETQGEPKKESRQTTSDDG